MRITARDVVTHAAGTPAAAVGGAHLVRAFHNYATAADDHARLIATSPRYRDVMAHAGDPARMIEEIARAGYAMDTAYARKVNATIKSQQLTEYDAK